MSLRPISLEAVTQRLHDEFAHQQVMCSSGRWKANDATFEHVWKDFADCFNIQEAHHNISRGKQAPVLLDQGCGTGRALVEALQLVGGGQGVGLNASLASIEANSVVATHGGRSFANTYVIESRGALLQFLARDVHTFRESVETKFDYVFSRGTYQHLLFPVFAFDQACRSLNGNGLLTISDFPLTAEVVTREGVMPFSSYLPRVKELSSCLTYHKSSMPRRQLSGKSRVIVMVGETNTFESGLVFGELDGKLIAVDERVVQGKGGYVPFSAFPAQRIKATSSLETYAYD